jgi:hypothetical protein
VIAAYARSADTEEGARHAVRNSLALIESEIIARSLKHSFWFVELWYEQRGLFKELVKHIFVFGILLSTLEGSHWILGKSQLQEARLLLLDKFHFWSSIVLLVIFAVSLIIKVVLFETGVRK